MLEHHLFLNGLDVDNNNKTGPNFYELTEKDILDEKIKSFKPNNKIFKPHSSWYLNRYGCKHALDKWIAMAYEKAIIMENTWQKYIENPDQNYALVFWWPKDNW